MDRGSKRITKRSSNACTRCRRQKIKCSGLQPCDGCTRRKVACIFDDRDSKILVTQGYIADLQQKIARLERQAGLLSPPVSSVEPASDKAGNDDSVPAKADASPLSGPGDSSQPMAGSPSREPEGSELTNPLTATPSTFMAAPNGRAFYLGTSSNWSFSRQVLSLAHDHAYQAPLPTAALLFDGSAYDLGWDGSRQLAVTAGPVVLPSLDYAIYLINAVKFHCGQLYHLFDEDDFSARLHRFYADASSDRVEQAGLWYVHFMAVLAFGKTFIVPRRSATHTHAQHGHLPSGADFFGRALQLLPDTTSLCAEPIESTEVLCCIALYLQALDYRNSAHVYIGQAMRIAMGYGMHTDMPVAQLGEHLVQRCRTAWWTTYVLDRHMTSLMGLPQSIRDDDVHCQLPTFAGMAQRAASLHMQIRLAQITAEINRTVYGRSGSLHKKFLYSTKTALESLASLADELRQSFPLHPRESLGGVSRISAHLHLLYHQSIIVATRPLLYCCLQIRFKWPRQLEALVASRTVRSLLLMCVEAAQQILTILESVHAQGLLETFLPFDLDSLFVSLTILQVAAVVDPQLVVAATATAASDLPWMHRGSALLDEMVAGGNRIAAFRKTEVQTLDDVLGDLAMSPGMPPLRHDSAHTASPDRLCLPRSDLSAAAVDDTLPLSHDTHSSRMRLGDDTCVGSDLTTEQILAVANSIQSEDAEWISRSIMENSFWEME